MRPVSNLSKVTMAGLVAMGAEILIGMRSAGVLVPAGLTFAVLPIFVALLITTGVRWLPGLGAGLALTMMAFAVQSPLFIARVTNPEMGAMFALAILQLAGGCTAVVAGLAATLDNYRRPRRGAKEVKTEPASL